MKKTLLLFFLPYVLNAQTSYNESQTVKVTLEDPSIQADTIKIKVMDKKTNKSALVELNRSAENPDVFVGYHILNFSNQQQMSELVSNHKRLKIEKVSSSQSANANARPNLEPKNNNSAMNAQEELLQKQMAMAQLSEAEKQKRQNEAAKLNLEGEALYEQNKFSEANKKFKQASELDPSNSEYLFNYGVGLHQTQDYNKSIDLLATLDDDNISEAERNYFLGLNYYRLNELPKATQHFDKVIETESAELAPTASFYNGVTTFNSADYSTAKTHFEYVLDHSKDKEMDKQSDQYLDKIQAIEQFEKQNKLRWRYSLFLGPVYDDNILNIAKVNTPTDQGGYRAYYGGQIEYRPIMTYQKEWNVQATVSDMYSYNKKFKKEDSLQAADPLAATLKSTYKIKDFNFSKPVTLAITPGVDTLMMRNTNETKRSLISTSYFLQVNPFIVHSDLWFGSYLLEYRQDQSKLKDVADADNLSGTKYTIATTQTYLLNKEKARSLLFDLGYMMYNAKGDNQKYNKIMAAATYVTPWIWKTISAARLDYSISDYIKNADDRKDQILTGTLSASKVLSEKWSASLSVSYSSSASNVDLYDYSKLQVFNLYTYSGMF